MMGEQLPAYGDVHQGNKIAEEKMTQWSMVNLSGVLRQDSDFQLRQQGRGLYLLPTAYRRWIERLVGSVSND